MKELKLIIFPIILFLFLVGMVFVFTSGTLSSLLPTFEQAPEDTGIIADVTYSFNPGDNIEGWENGYPWKEFILSYTDNWKVNEVTKDEAKGKLAVSFQNADGSYFDIIQGVSDGGRCVFKDEADFDTFKERGVSFNAYTEYKKGKIVWRLAKFDIATDWTHALCERSQNAEGKSVYYSVNSVGINRISLKTPKSAKEFSEIIKKLEVK